MMREGKRLLQIRSLGKRYPGRHGRALGLLAGGRRGRARPAGPERRGQVDADGDPRDGHPAHLGHVLLGGQRRRRATRCRCAARLGYLPQDFGVYERLTAREFLLYLGRLKGLSGAELSRRVQQLLELTNLHGAANRRLGGYSGGMRQRVGIAQALLGDPKLVIVDEPTVGLDPEERVRFRNLLSEIAHNRVVILSTHIVSDVEAVASQIAVIRQGRLVSQTTPEDLLRKATGRVFTAVVASEGLAEAQHRVHVSNLIRRADGVHVRYVANGNGATLPGARAIEPTLEDAYLLSNLESAAASVSAA